MKLRPPSPLSRFVGALRRASASEREPHQHASVRDSLSKLLFGSLSARNDERFGRAAAELKTRATSAFTMDVEFHQLGLRLHSNGMQVLAGVTGSCRKGRITAVMGPSGAGKTTFMNTLAGRAAYGRTTGEILINGKLDSVHNYSPWVGFVPQDDIMLRELTVFENLAFYAELRLPPAMEQAEKDRIVSSVIDVLGLSHIAHSPIGDETTRGISGGQRKRVNVGMELVSWPSLLFLDEPTSGLDSTTSMDLLKGLRASADAGCNVVVVLHQPSFPLYCLFHDVLLLGRGGQTVYLGPSDEALAYFESLGFVMPELYNPADFFMDVIAGHFEAPLAARVDEFPAADAKDAQQYVADADQRMLLFFLWDMRVKHGARDGLHRAACSPMVQSDAQCRTARLGGHGGR